MYICGCGCVGREGVVCRGGVYGVCVGWYVLLAYVGLDFNSKCLGLSGDFGSRILHAQARGVLVVHTHERSVRRVLYRGSVRYTSIIPLLHLVEEL